MSGIEPMPCPLCGEAAEGQLHFQRPAGDWIAYFRCKQCGEFNCSSDHVNQLSELGIIKKATLSWFVRKNHLPQRPVDLSGENLRHVLVTETLPTPAKQANNLLLWLGDELETAGQTREMIDATGLPSRIGCAGISGVKSIFSHLIDSKLIMGEFVPKRIPCVRGVSLTMKGWMEYEKLAEKRIDSKLAFMAMPFENDSVRRAFDECFKNAVKRAGFELQIVSDYSTSGLIDNHITVGIMRSAFVIADLTQANNGAYWEAGIAEGLGRPVFYTCEKSWFDAHKTHFDTNHHVTTIWSLDSLQQSENELADRIRRTFPDRAKLDD